MSKTVSQTLKEVNKMRESERALEELASLYEEAGLGLGKVCLELELELELVGNSSVRVMTSLFEFTCPRKVMVERIKKKAEEEWLNGNLIERPTMSPLKYCNEKTLQSSVRPEAYRLATTKFRENLLLLLVTAIVTGVIFSFAEIAIGKYMSLLTLIAFPLVLTLEVFYFWNDFRHYRTTY